MANAITPRQQGDDYQARFFWLQACRLFQPHTKVARVGFELSRVKSFDDVMVTYTEPLCYERGDKIAADYFQVKFHVSQAGAFTCDALIDPKFINATSVSLLQRLRAAQLTFAPEGTGCRFIIVSPWVIHPDDPLADIVSNNGGELRLQVLFDGTTDASRMGKVRKKWREHLGLTDAELEKALRPLRIFEKAPTLVGLSDDLNRQFDSLGFVPVEAGTLVHPYDDLIKKLLAQGSNDDARYMHGARWPHSGRDKFLLMAGETTFNLQCDETSGAFMTWDATKWRKTKTFTMIDEYRVENGTWVDGNPAAQRNCTSHWHEEHPDFRNGGLVAVAFYDHGTRFLNVSKTGKISDAGWFMPYGGQTSAVYWITDEIVYSVDYNRGLDVLRFNADA